LRDVAIVPGSAAVARGFRERAQPGSADLSFSILEILGECHLYNYE